MSKLFSSFKIKNLESKNRVMRSATTSHWSDEDGILRQPILDYYRLLAKGDLGIIIKGHSYISKAGKAHTGQSGLSEESHLSKMIELTKLVHYYGVPIIAQINHAGLSSKADRVTASIYKTDDFEAREATPEDVATIIENFASSAELAIQAGFDGVQIHSAHGYLLSQFLSKNINKREDSYGGNLENRSRLLMDVFDAIKKKIGNEPVIGVKLNCDDFAPQDGIEIKDSIQVSKWLAERGIDFIEISGGGPKQDAAIRKTRGKPSSDSPYFEANFSGHTEKIREAVPKTALALVDGIRERSTMDALLENDIVDFVSMSKPFIRDPYFSSRLNTGKKRPDCIDCRKCLSRERFGKRMLTCAVLDP
ncbi:MAG: oxidoreductase [Candidatus Heimdallarchaeota archaeon]